MVTTSYGICLRGKDAEAVKDTVRFAMVYMEDLLHSQLHKQAG